MKENKNDISINKIELKEKLKENIIIINNQIKKGCEREICYNIYCKNNLFCQLSKKNNF